MNVLTLCRRYSRGRAMFRAIQFERFDKRPLRQRHQRQISEVLPGKREMRVLAVPTGKSVPRRRGAGSTPGSFQDNYLDQRARIRMQVSNFRCKQFRNYPVFVSVPSSMFKFAASNKSFSTASIILQEYHTVQ